MPMSKLAPPINTTAAFGAMPSGGEAIRKSIVTGVPALVMRVVTTP